MQQQSQQQQQTVPRQTHHQQPDLTGQTQQPQYYTVTSNVTVHQRDYLLNQQKKLPSSPRSSRGQKRSHHRRNGILKYGNKKLGKSIPNDTKFAVDPYNTVFNLGSKTFSKYEYQLLNKNLNFCPTPKIYNKNVLNPEINKF